MYVKRMKIGIGILMTLILLLAGRIILMDVLAAADSEIAKQVKSSGSNVPSNVLKVTACYSLMADRAAVRVSVEGKYKTDTMLYVPGKVTSVKDAAWNQAEKVGKDGRFFVSKKGTYSILVLDSKGNAKITTVSVKMEMRAVWIYFSEMQNQAESLAKWKKFIDTTYATCKRNYINTVILQVRPCADAMYPSDYFPWSFYAAGKAGKNPGFDPLAYAVEAAHEQGLSIQAWVNPYRVTMSTTKLSSLPKGSVARRWASSKGKKRNVLSVNGALYFNPARNAVQELVAKGVKEIVKKYDVDGIHLDDYFYPSLGTANNKKFDYREYISYAARQRKAGNSVKSLVGWRRSNVDSMVRKVYAAVKAVDKNCLFGISPAGNIDNLYSRTSYYSDVKKWMKNPGYIDYICPQLYWSFTQHVAPYKKLLDEWASLPRNKNVNLYIGLAGYRAGISLREAKALSDTGWAKSNTILKRQVQYGRKSGEVTGFFIFSYSTYENKNAKKEVKNMNKLFAR